MTAFSHQHGDPRGLLERIDAQLRQRIEEAVEMAGLELLVKLRQRRGRPALEEGSASDRREHEALVAELLAHLRRAFGDEIAEPERRAPAEAETLTPDARAQALADQVLLAKRLPDYWQRFEAHRAAYAGIRLSERVEAAGWLRRLFGRAG
jgi:hypothetical protein